MVREAAPRATFLLVIFIGALKKFLGLIQHSTTRFEDDANWPQSDVFLVSRPLKKTEFFCVFPEWGGGKGLATKKKELFLKL